MCERPSRDTRIKSKPFYQACGYRAPKEVAEYLWGRQKLKLDRSFLRARVQVVGAVIDHTRHRKPVAVGALALQCGLMFAQSCIGPDTFFVVLMLEVAAARLGAGSKCWPAPV